MFLASATTMDQSKLNSRTFRQRTERLVFQTGNKLQSPSPKLNFPRTDGYWRCEQIPLVWEGCLQRALARNGG